jgi:hypothetical protein
MIEGFKKGVVFYYVFEAKEEKYAHLKKACCRRFRTTGFNNKPNSCVIITFGDNELISFSPSISFSKKSLEAFLLFFFSKVELVTN